MNGREDWRASKSMIRGTLVLLLVVGALAVALGAGEPAQAQAPTVGMTLDASGPVECNAQGCTVQSADQFSITLHADPAPTFDMSGFGAEVVFDGLVWFMRDCADQLQIERGDGGDVAACAQAPGPAGQARVAVISEVAAPPLSPFEDLSNGDTIFDLALRCPQAGTYEVILTAVTGQPATDAPFGAIFFRNDATEFPVRTQGTAPLDLESTGNTRNVAVADRLTITCQGGGGVGFQSPVPAGTSAAPTPGAQTTGTPGNGDATALGTAGATATGGELSPEDVTATAIAAAVAGDSDGDDGDDDSMWLWVIVAAAVAAVAGGLGFLAWRRYQAGGGGPTDGVAPPAGESPSGGDTPRPDTSA